MDKTKRLVFFALALGAAARVLYLMEHRSSPFFEPAILDPAYYQGWATRVLKSGWAGEGPFFGLPLYPLFLSIVYKIAGVHVLLVKILQQIFGLVNAGLVFMLAQRLFGRRDVSVMSAFLAALYAPYLFHETMLIPEAIGIPLYTGALLLALHFWESKKIASAAALGAAVAAAGLTKAGVFLFLPLFLLFFLWKNPAPMGERIRKAALAMAALVIVILPVAWHNAKAADDAPFLTWHSGLNFYIGNHPGANGIYQTPPGMRSNIEGQMADSVMIAEKEAGRRLKPTEVSKFWAGKARAFIRSHPRETLGLAARKLWLLVNYREISEGEDFSFTQTLSRVLRYVPFDFTALWMLALPGLVFGLRELSFPRRTTILLWLAAYTIGVAAFFVNARYRLPLISALMPFAAYAAFRFMALLKPFRPAPAGLMIILILSAFLMSRPNLVQPKIAVQLTNVGNVWMSQGNLDKAVEFYRRAVKEDPDYDKAYNDLGTAYRAQRRPADAIASFEEAIRRNPSNAHAHNNLGLMLFGSGEVGRAEALFRKSLEIQPNLPESHNNLGMVLAKKGDIAGAENSFKMAITLNPRSAKAWTNLGMVWYLKGNVPEARRCWQQALAIDPTHADARMALQSNS